MSDRGEAPAIFLGIAPQYSWVGGVMSFGQDGRWRREMVTRTGGAHGPRILDVAAGTGLVSRALAGSRPDARIIALDPSEAMLSVGATQNASAGLDARIHPVLGHAESLPFPDATFDAVTFTYLLRYVDDPPATVRELARVLRPGGILASLEFHVPDGPALRLGWRWYTRFVLPSSARPCLRRGARPARSSGRASSGSSSARRSRSRPGGGRRPACGTSAAA